MLMQSHNATNKNQSFIFKYGSFYLASRSSFTITLFGCLSAVIHSISVLVPVFLEFFKILYKYYLNSFIILSSMSSVNCYYHYTKKQSSYKYCLMKFIVHLTTSSIKYELYVHYFQKAVFSLLYVWNHP